MKELQNDSWSDKIALTIRTYTKKLRLLKVNRELLVFFVFLCISGFFWLLQAFQQNTSLQVDYKIQIVNIPEQLVITSEIPESISATFEGRGYDLVTLKANSSDICITIDYKDITKTENELVIDNSLWKRHISKITPGTISLISVSPAQVSLPYSKGDVKKVPVIYAGNATTGTQHTIYSIEITPDSVDIYAPDDIYKSVNVIYTEKKDYDNLDKHHKDRLALNPQNGVKVMTDSVDIEFSVDLFTEKSFTIPIQTHNVPSKTLLHTFPSKATIQFRVSAQRFNSIKKEDFKIVADYNSITPENHKCKLTLLDKPVEITNVKIAPENVEYIIEHINSPE